MKREVLLIVIYPRSKSCKYTFFRSQQPLKKEVQKPFNNLDVDEGEDDVTSFTSEERETSRSSQLATQQDYSEFCAKIPNSELYRCHRCSFTNRFPSKVKRHFYYRHAKVPPYRCGHCPFEAVERGKVARHSQLVHRSLPVIVVQQEVEIAPLGFADLTCRKAVAGSYANLNETDIASSSAVRVDDTLCVATAVTDERLDVDCEAPLLDYYPKLEDSNSASPSGRNGAEIKALFRVTEFACGIGVFIR
jgi:hypothetical protein